MNIFFGFKNWGDPVILQLSSETLSTYVHYKRQKRENFLLFFLLFAVAGFLYVNTLFSFVTKIKLDDMRFVLLTLACVGVGGTYYTLASRKPRACLIYACLNTDDFEDYLKAALNSMQEYLSIKHIEQTQITNKVARQMCKKICDVQTLIDLSDILNKEEDSDVFKAILKAGDISEFYTEVLSYEFE